MESKNNIEKLNSKNKTFPTDDGDDLFAPSDKVWENVSKHLPVKKKRRRFLPIILLCMITIAAGLALIAPESSLNKNYNDQSKLNFDTTKEINETQTSSFSSPESIVSKSNDSVNLANLEQVSNTKKVLAISHKDASYHSQFNSQQSYKANPKGLNKNIVASESNNYAKLSSNRMIEDDALDNTQKISIVGANDALSSANNIAFELPLVELQTNQAIDEVNAETERPSITEVLPLETLSLRLVQEEKQYTLPIEQIQIIATNEKKWMYGLGLAVSPFTYNSPKVSDPLEGVIKTSAYKNEIQLNLSLNYSLNDHLFLSMSPGIVYDQLSTSYDLSIPYDYNTEKTLSDKKENYFSHSLPTDLGNVKTNMVVNRAIDSPVLHNEKINIEFDVNYNALSITNAVGLHYAFKTKENGLYAGIRFAPQFVVNRNADVKRYESKHTYVNGDHVDITLIKNYKNLYLGGDFQTGYRMSVIKHKMVVDFSTTLHKNFMSEGRPFAFGLGLALMKSF